MNTKQSTLENNKLIVEFMEYTIQTDPKESWFGRYYKPNYGWIKENEFYFNTDWNDLMQVVEKIESLGYFMQIDSIGCIISQKNVDLFKTNSRNKKEAVYNSCVEFIKYYNN